MCVAWEDMRANDPVGRNIMVRVLYGIRKKLDDQGKRREYNSAKSFIIHAFYQSKHLYRTQTCLSNGIKTHDVYSRKK